MSDQGWAELRGAIARLNWLLQRLADLERQVRSLQQQLRDARGGG